MVEADSVSAAIEASSLQDLCLGTCASCLPFGFKFNFTSNLSNGAVAFSPFYMTNVVSQGIERLLRFGANAGGSYSNLETETATLLEEIHCLESKDLSFNTWLCHILAV